MPSLQRVTFYAALCTAALLLAFATFAWIHPKEPTYHGKPLSYWMLANARPVNKDQPDPAVALSAIGSNAVPFLLKWAEQRTYNWQKQLRPYRDKSPLLRKVIPYWATGIDKQNRALAALHAIPRLGPAASPAIPRLAALANSDRDPAVGRYATEALALMEAIPALVTVATNQHAMARLNAIQHLGQLHHAAAVPALLQCLNDTNASASSAAASSLGLINQEPAVVVTALIAALRRAPNTWSWPPADARFALVSALSEFGTNADVAVPEFLRHLSLTDKRDPFCCSLVAALCRVSAQPRTILPALATCLQSRNADLRRCTVIALSSMGPGARFALENLTNALQFQDTRPFVSEAIGRITSQATTTASPP